MTPHAVKILTERQLELERLIRICKQNSDLYCAHIPTKDYELDLADIIRAITALTEQSNG